MIVTFKPVVIPGNRHKDGTYPVKIRVTFKGKTRRLPTTLVAYPDDMTRSLRIKSADILSKSEDLIRKMREEIADLSYFELETMDVDAIVGRIRARRRTQSFRLDFFSFGDEIVAQKAVSTGKAYTVALNALERYLGKRELDINDITSSMLAGFVSSRPETGQYINFLRYIFKQARERYNDDDNILIPRTPFDSVKVPSTVHQGQRNLGVDLIRRIFAAEPSSKLVRFSLDAFRLSFLTMGANIADLCAAPAFQGDEWVYRRAKTSSRRRDKAEIRVKVPPEALPYIAGLQEGDPGWWLPALHKKGAVVATVYVNRGLAAWCHDEGVETFTFYAARHSWASIGRSLGIEKATIDDGLGHVGDFSVADIYADKSWETVNKANRKIIDAVLQTRKK